MSESKVDAILRSRGFDPMPVTFTLAVPLGGPEPPLPYVKARIDELARILTWVDYSWFLHCVHEGRKGEDVYEYNIYVKRAKTV